MSKLIADRGFIEVNGNEVVLLKTANLTIDASVSTSDTMTRNYRSSGYKYGNFKISLKASMDITRKQAQIDLFLADPEAEVNAVFICGGERYTVKDIAQAVMALDASVGDASKNLDLIGLDFVNENGNAVNSTLSLG